MWIFQSTLSVRRATDRRDAAAEAEKISIHALRKERDWMTARRNGSRKSFQSTLSVRRATARPASTCSNKSISIHALRKESDSNRTCRDTRQPISIHALRKESDFFFLFLFGYGYGFQSTLSVRRATMGLRVGLHHPADFNPRSP